MNPDSTSLPLPQPHTPFELRRQRTQWEAVHTSSFGSGNRRLVDALNGRIQHGVEFGIVLMDGQTFQ